MSSATNEPTGNVASSVARVLASKLQWQSDAGMFDLLARLWAAEVDLALLKELCASPLRESLTELGFTLPATVCSETIEQLAVEFCSCFLGPKHHLPPYQSVVADSRFQGDCVDSMNKYLEIIGPPSGLVAEARMLDHAAVQLQAMGVVSHELSQAADSSANADSLPEDQFAKVESLLQLRESFGRKHLAWLRNYCDVAVKKSTNDFYCSLFRVTGDFLGSLD